MSGGAAGVGEGESGEATPALDASTISLEEEDAYNPEWKNQKKHVFILSESGKPIYSR